MIPVSEVPEGASLFIIDTSPSSPHKIIVRAAEVTRNCIKAQSLTIGKNFQDVCTAVMLNMKNNCNYYFLEEEHAKISLNIYIQKLLEKRIKSYCDIIKMDSSRLSEIEEELREFKENKPELFI